MRRRDRLEKAPPSPELQLVFDRLLNETTSIACLTVDLAQKMIRERYGDSIHSTHDKIILSIISNGQSRHRTEGVGSVPSVSVVPPFIGAFAPAVARVLPTSRIHTERRNKRLHRHLVLNLPKYYLSHTSLYVCYFFPYFRSFSISPIFVAVKTFRGWAPPGKTHSSSLSRGGCRGFGSPKRTAAVRASD